MDEKATAMMQDANSQICSYAGEIAAYLDGELLTPDENSFEQHLIECAECLEKLNMQKRLLCALDFAFDNEKNFDLPVNFAKSVAVRAESDVSGLRSRDERGRALLISSGLLLLGFLVGIIGKKSGFLSLVADKFSNQIFVVLKVLGDFCYDFGLGLKVILRVVGRQFIESPLAGFLLLVLFVVSSIVLSRRLFKFHRA
ncbi:MAG: zf-HC2 domain-containing protein [Pyrinomonadaceae bacterium]